MDEIERKVLQATKALIRIHGKDAAYLEMIASDEFRFQYLSSYCEQEKLPISLAVPLRNDAYITETLLPFFDNLLFEGEQFRIFEKQYGLRRQSTIDRFRLLMLTGQETLSIVSVLPLVDNQVIDLSKRKITEITSELAIYPLESAYKDSCAICLRPSVQNHINCVKSLWGTLKPIHIEAFAQDPQNIFRTIVPGQSLSGAQRKALFSLQNSGVLKRFGTPTHIIKPEGEFKEMPANEHLTMAVAKQLKFKVPAIGLYRTDKIEGFLYVIRRFDRTEKKQSFAMEDIAQLAEELAEDKDRASMNLVAETIKSYATSPRIEFADFFRRLLFCFLTGNGDMHLKNWALLYDLELNLKKLAPVYDLLNVRASYPQEQVEMILPINGKQKDLSKKDFVEFGRDVLKLNSQFIHKTFTLMGLWKECLDEFCVRSCLSEARKKRYKDVVKERFHKLK